VLNTGPVALGDLGFVLGRQLVVRPPAGGQVGNSLLDFLQVDGRLRAWVGGFFAPSFNTSVGICPMKSPCGGQYPFGPGGWSSALGFGHSWAVLFLKTESAKNFFK